MRYHGQPRLTFRRHAGPGLLSAVRALYGFRGEQQNVAVPNAVSEQRYRLVKRRSVDACEPQSLRYAIGRLVPYAYQIDDGGDDFAQFW